MKMQIRKWILRLAATGLLLSGLLIGLVLTPSLLYANKTTIGSFTIYHNSPLDNNFINLLDDAAELVKASELYDQNLKLDICLNDNDSKYPALISKLGGAAFARGFYDKVVMMGNTNYKDNFAELNGYKWNLTQLIAHEIIHCLQFNKSGFWNSNPVAKIPEWKWKVILNTLQENKVTTEI